MNTELSDTLSLFSKCLLCSFYKDVRTSDQALPHLLGTVGSILVLLCFCATKMIIIVHRFKTCVEESPCLSISSSFSFASQSNSNLRS